MRGMRTWGELWLHWGPQRRQEARRGPDLMGRGVEKGDTHAALGLGL